MHDSGKILPSNKITWDSNEISSIYIIITILLTMKPTVKCKLLSSAVTFDVTHAPLINTPLILHIAYRKSTGNIK